MPRHLNVTRGRWVANEILALPVVGLFSAPLWCVEIPAPTVSWNQTPTWSMQSMGTPCVLPLRSSQFQWRGAPLSHFFFQRKEGLGTDGFLVNFPEMLIWAQSWGRMFYQRHRWLYSCILLSTQGALHFYHLPVMVCSQGFHHWGTVFFSAGIMIQDTCLLQGCHKFFNWRR